MAAAARRRGPSRRGHYPRPQGPTHDFLSLSDLTPAQYCCARLGGSAWRPPGTQNRRRKSQCATPRTGPAPANKLYRGMICRWQQRFPQSKQGRACSLGMFFGSSGPESPSVILAGSRLEGKAAVKLTGAKPLSPVLWPCACARAGTWSRPLTASRNINCPLSARPLQCPGRGAQTGQSPAAGELCEKRS